MATENSIDKTYRLIREHLSLDETIEVEIAKHDSYITGWNSWVMVFLPNETLHYELDHDDTAGLTEVTQWVPQDSVVMPDTVIQIDPPVVPTTPSSITVTPEVPNA